MVLPDPNGVSRHAPSRHCTDRRFTERMIIIIILIFALLIVFFNVSADALDTLEHLVLCPLGRKLVPRM